MQAIQTRPQWNPITERKPDYGKEVLFRTPSKKYIVGYRFDNWGQDDYTTGSFGSGSFDVEAWMEIPE